MLYLLESHLSNQDLTSLCQQVTKADDLVCLNDGVYCLNQLASSAARLHVMADHASLRGVVINDKAQAIDMMDLVALTVKHPTSVTR